MRQVFDPELAVERPQVALHRVDAEEDLVGDLLVGRRGGEVVAGRDRPTERCEDAKLGIGEAHVGRGVSVHESECTVTNDALFCSYPWRLR